MTTLEIIFATLSTFLMVFLFFLSRYLIKADKRGEDAQKILCLILRGVKKSGQLAYANAVAYINHEINGEMDIAVKDYKECMEELDRHIENQAFKK